VSNTCDSGLTRRVNGTINFRLMYERVSNAIHVQVKELIRN